MIHIFKKCVVCMLTTKNISIPFSILCTVQIKKPKANDILEYKSYLRSYQRNKFSVPQTKPYTHTNIIGNLLI